MKYVTFEDSAQKLRIQNIGRMTEPMYQSKVDTFKDSVTLRKNKFV